MGGEPPEQPGIPREYKRRFAWIKAGKNAEKQFAAWHKAAKAKKKDCDREAIPPDEFKAWLKNSQPYPRRNLRETVLSGSLPQINLISISVQRRLLFRPQKQGPA